MDTHAPFAAAAPPLADATPVDDAARDAVLEAMLTQQTDAHIVAIGRNGIFVPMPTSVPLRGQHVITGATSMLDLAVADDRLKVIETFERCLAVGAATEVVHTLAAADRPVQLHFIDAAHRHHVILGFLVGLEEGDGEPADVDQVVLPPRVAVLRKGPHAVIIEADEATSRLLGWTAEELVGRRTTEFIHPEDHERAIATWMDLLGRPGATRRVRLRHRHKDGAWVWFEVTNHNLLHDPERGYVLTEMLDISDEMAALEALRASEQLLRRLTEALPEGVLQVDTGRQVVYRNERLAAITGSAAATVEGLLALVAPADRGRVEQAVTAVLQEGRDDDLEVGYGRPGGGAHRCSVSLRALTAEDGTVTGALLCLADVTEDARLREELTHRATYDPLTRCRNRASILSVLDELLSPSKRNDQGAAVVYADLNKFKAVNDQLGHAAGDRLLTHVAGQLLGAVRDGDLVGRLGGDEFLVVCRRVHSAEEALAIGERIVAAVAGSQLTIGGEQVTPSLSVGIAWTPPGGCSAEALIARADEAMYHSKQHRNGAPTLAER